MDFLSLEPIDLIGILTGFTLTISVFSYLAGDNALFRFAIYLFIGVSTGLAAAVALRNVIIPKLFLVFFNTEGGLQAILWNLVPLILSGLLMMKLSKNLASVGNVAMAYLVGVGAAAAISGALVGTLFSQVEATTNLLKAGSFPSGPIGGIIGMTGTIATLIYFHFGAKAVPNDKPARNQIIEWGAVVGQIFIAITFGSLFAGVYMVALTALIERVGFIWSIFQGMMTTLS